MGYRISCRDKGLLEALQQALSAQPGKDWTLDDLCRETGLNRVKLCKGFAQLYGLSPFAFLACRRMALARELLQTTDEPIKAVASLCGYRNVKSFHRAFRACFGCTPFTVRLRVSCVQPKVFLLQLLLFANGFFPAELYS